MILSGTITLSPTDHAATTAELRRAARGPRRATPARRTAPSRPCSPPGAAVPPTPSAHGGRRGAPLPPASSRSWQRRRRRSTWRGRTRVGRRRVVRAARPAARMTAYDVDLDELRATLAELAACQRDLVGIAAEIDQAQAQLQTGGPAAPPTPGAVVRLVARRVRRHGHRARRAAGDRRRRGRVLLAGGVQPTSGSGSRSARDVHATGSRSRWRRRRTSARRPCSSVAAAPAP